MGSQDIDVFVFTRSTDIDGASLDVPQDQWTSFSPGVQVFYADKSWHLQGLVSQLRMLSPNAVYLNGVYSWIAVIAPLLLAKFGRLDARLVLAPRGMLIPSALARKRLKKSLYLPMFRWLIDQRLRFHVTDSAEVEAVDRFKSNQKREVIELPNLPAIDISYQSNECNERTAQRFTMITIALISPMKGIGDVLQALKRFKGDVTYRLFGPVLDEAYWRQCQKLIVELPENVVVNYEGAIAPDRVAAALAESDVYVQPSRSENFGHSIYEALMNGLPVITSHNTPWQNLEAAEAGWNVADIDELDAALNAAHELNGDHRLRMSRGARALAEAAIDRDQMLEGYANLFGFSEN